MSEVIITIRPARLNDLTELQQLFVDTITTVCTPDYDARQIEVWTAGVENTKRWKDMLEQQTVFVAQHMDNIVGFATLDNGTYIDMFYVHKDYQRKGIAQRLMNEVINETKQLGQSQITSDVSITARAFFEKNGFRSQREQINIRQGIELINYKMQKDL